MGNMSPNWSSRGGARASGPEEDQIGAGTGSGGWLGNYEWVSMSSDEEEEEEEEEEEQEEAAAEEGEE